MKDSIHAQSGFTLIELSIVLVIIGLIVGGVFVGQDLIASAAIRAQISQIEKYNTAVNTFRGKYEYLPGDIIPTAVTQYGFTVSPTRAGTAGQGDGNGYLEGVNGVTSWAYQINGENELFWEDLSANSHLIDANFSTYDINASSSLSCSGAITGASFFPQAKIGRGNIINTYSGATDGSSCQRNCGANYFVISINTGCTDNMNGSSPAAGLTVAEAYKIDAKIDDGLPRTGRVIAAYLKPSNGQPGQIAISGSPTATSCSDAATGSWNYSLSQNNGKGVNCALSFQFQ